MATLSEPTLSRNDERFFKNSLFIPKIEVERKRQELTDALQYCHILMFQNGLNTAVASNEISIRSKEIGKQMYFCLTALIKEVLLKDEKEVSEPTKGKVVHCSHPNFIKEQITSNSIFQPDVKKGVAEESEIEEIIISSSEDECSKTLPSFVESEHTERKFQQENEQSQLSGPTEPVIKTPLKKKSKKEKGEAVESEIKQYKEYQIDSWVYQQIKILRKKSAPIYAKTVKQLAVKASAIYTFPEFKPTKEWITRFSEMYNVNFENDEEKNGASVSLSTGEDECIDHGIIFRKKNVLKAFKRLIPFAKESIDLHSGKFRMNPAAIVDFTPIEVDLAAMQRKSKQSQKKPVKAKDSSGKQLPKKPNRKNKKKKLAKKRLLKELQMNAWVFEQLKIMKKNSLPIDSQTVKELALKAGNIFLQSKFKPTKEWTCRFWKVYKKQLERCDEVSNPTEIIQEEMTNLQPKEEDTTVNHDLPLGIKKEARSKYEIKREKNQLSVSVQEEAPYDYIPLIMKKENPKSDVLYLVSSEEIHVLSSDDECQTNSSERKSMKRESIS